MRLMRPILAALLAVCIAIFPIAMPRAAAMAGHSHQTASAAHAHEASGHAHEHASASSENGGAHLAVIAEHDAHASDGEASGDGPSCCGTTTCHSFQTSSPPMLCKRLPVMALVEAVNDHQVQGLVSGRLDRPPRTV